MTEYEELVKRLREPDKKCDDCSDKDNYDACLLCIDSLFKETADAIEELSKQVELEHQSGFADGQIAANRKKPRWIPVTELLPEENQIVVAHEGKGTWDFGMFRGISASGNPEYWHWKKNTFKRVKWWMPKDGALPEPPKEEA